MDKDILIVVLLVAVILTSIIQTFQVVSFQSTVNGLKTTGAITGAASAPSTTTSAPRASSGVGGC